MLKETTGLPTITYLGTFAATASLTVTGDIIYPMRTAGERFSASTSSLTLARSRGMTTNVSSANLNSITPVLISSRWAFTTQASASLNTSSVMLWKQVFRRVGIGGGHTVPPVEEDIGFVPAGLFDAELFDAELFDTDPWPKRVAFKAPRGSVVKVASDTTNRPRQGRVKDESDAY
jgi:hypothetical protein